MPQTQESRNIENKNSNLGMNKIARRCTQHADRNELQDQETHTPAKDKRPKGVHKSSAN